MAWRWAGLLCCWVLISMQCLHFVHSLWMAASWPFAFCFSFAWWGHGKQNEKTLYTSMFSLLFTYFCLSLFLLLFVNHFSFVFCLICLPSANAFHPRVCRLQPLQPSGLQQPPAGRELRRLQQGNELMEGFGGGSSGREQGTGLGKRGLFKKKMARQNLWCQPN